MKFYSSFFYAHIQYSTWVYSTNNNVNIVYQVCVCGVRKKKDTFITLNTITVDNVVLNWSIYSES